MSDTEAVTAAKPGESRYLPWLSIFVLWALVQVMVLAVGASPVFEGGLIGTDGYMRLVRVELLQETGAWFDGRIPRSNAPYGDTLHWTRPLDVLLLGAAWPIRFKSVLPSRRLARAGSRACGVRCQPSARPIARPGTVEPCGYNLLTMGN